MFENSLTWIHKILIVGKNKIVLNLRQSYFYRLIRRLTLRAGMSLTLLPVSGTLSICQIASLNLSGGGVADLTAACYTMAS